MKDFFKKLKNVDKKYMIKEMKFKNGFKKMGSMSTALQFQILSAH